MDNIVWIALDRPNRLKALTVEVHAELRDTFAIGMTKTLVYNEWNMSLPAAIEAEAEAQAICMITEDLREGYGTFMEDRPPVFHPK